MDRSWTFRDVCTCCGSPRHCGSADVDCVRAGALARRTEGRRCSVSEESALPGTAGALDWGYRDDAGVKCGCRGNAVAPGCGCHGSVGVQAGGRGQGWRAEPFSGCSCMFGGSLFLPRGESSARTDCRLNRGSKVTHP